MGAEDREHHIGFYSEQLAAFKTACKAADLDIPFLFHAGETLLDTGGSDNPENSNLYAAVALGAKRVGHAFSLMKHPRLVEKFRSTPEQTGICVELCPISNELLHLCRNVKQHPFPEFLAAGIPCTVNTDNPNLFRYSHSVIVRGPFIDETSQQLNAARILSDHGGRSNGFAAYLETASALEH